MGFHSTVKLIQRGVRRPLFRSLRRAPHHRWDMIKNMLDALVRNGRIETSLPKAKELQQYAEEMVYYAKKDDERSDLIVESMLRSAKARRLLYERIVPRYAFRPFHVTRVVNQWRFRLRDAQPRAWIEFVDRSGELRPARPVGNDRIEFLISEYQSSRKNRRKYEKEMRKFGLLDDEGKLLEKIPHLTSPYKWKSRPDDEGDLPHDDDIHDNASSSIEKGRKKRFLATAIINGMRKPIPPFHVDIPPHKRETIPPKLPVKFIP